MSDSTQQEFMVDGKLWTVKFVHDPRHEYYLREGRDGRWFRVPSASTIAAVEYSSSDALMRWAVKKHIEGEDFMEARDLAAEWGTAAHNQLEALATTGTPLSLADQPEHVRGCVQGVASWWLEHRPKFISSEIVVCSPSMKVAGRFDFIAEVDGELVMGDLKTSAAEVDWEGWSRNKARKAFTQMAGYALMHREMRWDVPQPTGRYVLRVGADGAFDWRRDHCPDLSELAFQHKLNAYRSDQVWGRAYKAAEKEIAEAWAA